MKNKLWILLLVTLSIAFTVQLNGQDDEPQPKDTQWFSGMPNYTIYEAQDIEFDSYNFWNGKNCTTVEGRKFRRVYNLKEDARKASVIQITRNYSNAITSMGGTIIFNGEPQDAECAEFNGLNIVVGKAVKGSDELWVEIATLRETIII